MKRVVTAILLVPIVVGLIFFAPLTVFTAATFVVAVLCFLEYRNIATHHAGGSVSLPIGIVGGAMLMLIPQVDPVVVALPLFAALAVELRGDPLSQVLPRTAGLAFGIFYCFIPWRCALALRDLNPSWLLFALAINWVGDSVAYYAGSAFGRRKLAPIISPGKSWEGTLASLAVTAVMGAGFIRWSLAPDWPLWSAVLVSLAANAAGQIGDLCESALKRGAGIKDSGHMLPGHGGWLDRLDSSLFSLPAVYLLLSRAEWLR